LNAGKGLENAFELFQIAVKVDFTNAKEIIFRVSKPLRKLADDAIVTFVERSQ